MGSALRQALLVCALLVCGTRPVAGEVIAPEQASLLIEPGGSASAIYLLSESRTPLFGYSLDFEIIPSPSASGTLSIDTTATNFFDLRNLITAGGLMRDPVFSTIAGRPTGAFVSTNVLGDGLVTATQGVNDVLAELVFRASPDAEGTFEVRLTDGSALSDGMGFGVPFDALTLSINVVPQPVAPMLLIAGIVFFRRR